MKDKLAKSIITLAFVVIICVVVARMLGNSETVSDYAAKQAEQKSSVSGVEDNTQDADDNILADEEKDVNIDDKADSSTVEVAEAESGITVTDEQDGDVLSDDEPVRIGCDGNPYNPREIVYESEDEYYIQVGADELMVVSPISDWDKEEMRGKSYADGIDESLVNFDMLRMVSIWYVDLEGNPCAGEIVCNKAIAKDLLEIFAELYLNGYCFEEVSRIDKYDADDTLSMEHNNTSCFNYRVVDSSTKLSNHAYGLAIDINPRYNPYITYKKDGTEKVSPENGIEYADRSKDFPYKIDENDLAYKLFTEHGFTWGGHWNSCKDYQHFEKKIK